MSDYPNEAQKAELYKTRGFSSFDLDEVSWRDAPMPRRFHKCWAQSSATFNWFQTTDRCACGAIRQDGQWHKKNSRRKK